MERYPVKHGNTVNTEYCDICRQKRQNDAGILSEIAKSENRTVKDWFHQFRKGSKSLFGKSVMEYTRKRIDDTSDINEGEQSNDDLSENFRSKVLPEDVNHCLEKFIKNGDIQLSEGRIQITHRGAFKVAGLVKLKIENSDRSKSGAHRTKDTGEVSYKVPYSRKMIFGDMFKHIDMNKTLMNSLVRNMQQYNKLQILLKPEDFHIHDKTFEVRMCIGLVIDESASMGDDKRAAAIDMCMSLGRLKRPGDVLKVFLYASQVRQIDLWDIMNIQLAGGTTDMKEALYVSRNVIKKEKGNKQIYLITDAEPNTENGKYIGFEKAMSGVKKEAILCKRESITINIIMLDNNSKLQQFAAHLARINAGRVFFASPTHSGHVVIKDYMASGNIM
jgi:uncharacterized protein with von Willebrand factor type A (vWA) domain